MSKILFKTIVGSHLWGMQHEGSDTDYFVCYVTDTKNLLLNNSKEMKSSFNSDTDKNIDISKHEIGGLIAGLESGNWNYLVGLFGIVVESSPEHKWLKKYIKNNPIKIYYNAVRGMAIQNYKKYIENDKDSSPERIQKITRSIEFMIRYLDTGKINFKPSKGKTKEDLLKELDALDKAYLASTLPAKLGKKPLEDFLLKLRIKMLKHSTS